MEVVKRRSKKEIRKYSEVGGVIPFPHEMIDFCFVMIQNIARDKI